MKLNLKDIYDLKFNYVIYDDGTIINEDSGKEIKPYNDSRRPNECPLIYLKKSDDKRLCMYHDQLMCESFINEYNSLIPIIHKDGNIYNCRLDNLIICDHLSILKNHYKETKEWKQVILDGIELYYDYYICEDGRLYNGNTDSFIKPFEDKRQIRSSENYLRYNLYVGKSSNEIIHYSAGRLVAMFFIPRANENYNVVIYRDNDYTNIDKSNLYWGDRYTSVMKSHMVDRDFTTIEDQIYGKEKWKIMKYFDVEFADEYLISNFGRIYNLTKEFYVSQINSGMNNYGQTYKYVSIYIYNDSNTEFTNISVHRLVAFNFVKNENPKINKIVNHINGNPEFNYSDNLEWCTPYDNIHHAIETNLINNKDYINETHNEEWKYYLFFSWAFSTIENLTLDRCYKFYIEFNSKYHDMSDLSYDKFVTLFNKISDTRDYQKLKEFYTVNYS